MNIISTLLHKIKGRRKRFLDTRVLSVLRQRAQDLFRIEPVPGQGDGWDDEQFQIRYMGKYNVIVTYNHLGGSDWTFSTIILKQYKSEKDALRDINEVRRLYILNEVKKLRKKRK